MAEKKPTRKSEAQAGKTAKTTKTAGAKTTTKKTATATPKVTASKQKTTAKSKPGTKTKSPAPGKPAKKTKAKKQEPVAAKKGKEDTEFIESLEEGIRDAGDQVAQIATDVAEKTSKLADDVFQKVKKGVSRAVDISSVVIDDLSKSAEKYAKKYQTKAEMKKLNKQRVEIALEMGTLFYLRYKQKKKLDSTFIADKKVQELLTQMDQIEKEIVRTGKKLDEIDS